MPKRPPSRPADGRHTPRLPGLLWVTAIAVGLPLSGLAGIYALARLADDWPEKRQMCVDLLCAYLRMPYPNGTFDADEVVVREAVTKLGRDHLADPDDPLNWCDLTLDFSGATFVNASFSGNNFRGGVSFPGATFTGRKESFERGVYVGGVCQNCVFTGQVSFFQARAHDAIIMLDSSTFDAEKVWLGGRFSGVHRRQPDALRQLGGRRPTSAGVAFADQDGRGRRPAPPRPRPGAG